MAARGGSLVCSRVGASVRFDTGAASVRSTRADRGGATGRRRRLRTAGLTDMGTI